MSINALEGFAPEWFAPSGQDDNSKPTRFEITPLDGQQFTHMQLMMDGVKLTGDTVDYALREGLSNWENFNNSSGEVTCNLLNQRLIPMQVRVAIASKIYEISLLSGVQAKNS